MHYPELLFPTKERRDRRKGSGGKFKPQKSRGKMSQDGKGGRSVRVPREGEGVPRGAITRKGIPPACLH